jgi:hypothetical protein
MSIAATLTAFYKAVSYFPDRNKERRLLVHGLWRLPEALELTEQNT